MATGNTTYNDLTPAVREAYKRLTLDFAKKDLVYMQFVENSTIDKNNGDRWLARRYDPYPVATTPLTDGVVGLARKPTYTDVSLEMDYYGDYTKVTKRTVYTNIENVTKNIMEVHGTQAGETSDTLMRNVIYSGASYVNATNGVNGGTPTEATYADIQTAVKLLRLNSAKMIGSKIGGSPNSNTSPVSKGYVCYFHSDLRDDIRNLDTFVPVHQYGRDGSVYNGEFGAVDDVRLIETNNGRVDSGTYSLFILGDKSVGGVHLSGEMLNVYRKGFGSAGTADPHNMFMSIGWDMMWGGHVQNDSWMTNLRVTHS